MTRIPDRLDRSLGQLLVVDVQAKLLPHIEDSARLLDRCALMLRAAQALGLPITVTEQNRARIGATDPKLMELAPSSHVYEKMTFSALASLAIRERVLGLLRPQVLLVGVETHVCVQQTALDLLRIGQRPWLLADAAGSRKAVDREIAIQRMQQAGVVVTTVEAAVFELLGAAGTAEFRAMLPHIK